MKKINDKINGKIDEKIFYRLEKNYKEALEDQDFENLIKKLDITMDTGMNYTTRLQTVVSDLRNSLKEHDYEDCPNSLKGYVLKARKDNHGLSFDYVMCPCLEKIKYLDNVKLFYNSRAIKDAKIEDIYTTDKNRKEIVKAINKFYKDYLKDKDTKAIYLYGSFGSGKTYIMSALLNKLAEKNIKSIIVHVPELIRSLKESFDTDYKEKFEMLKEVEILLLDDIGAEHLTEWSRDDVLEPLLNYRMENKKATFFTSNYSLKELEENHLTINNDKLRARRIIDRIKHMTNEIELVGKDWRK